MLVILSKTQDGCRVLLSHMYLMQLQHLEWSIFETVARKSTMIRSIILKKFYLFSDYIEAEFTKVNSPPKRMSKWIHLLKIYARIIILQRWMKMKLISSVSSK